MAETQPDTRTTDFLPARLAYLVLTLVLALVVIDNARWLRANTVPPSWDETRYLVNSLEAFDLISHPTLQALPQLYAVRHGMRPSLGYVWLAAPAYALWGTNPDTVTLWTNSILLALSVFATFAIGRRLFNTQIGLLAGVLAALNPEVIRLTRVYWPHLGVVTVATLGVYLLLLSDGLRRKRYIGLLGLLIAVGLMLRPIYPALFLAGPIGFVFLVALVETYRGQRSQGETATASPWRGLVIGRLAPAAVLLAVPTLILALPFYLQYGRRMFQFVESFQDSGTFAPVANVLSVQSFAWYFANLGYSIGLPFFLLFVGSLIVYLIALLARRVQPYTAILLAWLLVPYIALSLQATKEFYYLAPLVPAIALLLAFAPLYLLRTSWPVQLVAGTAMVALSVLLYWQVSWAQPLPADVARSLLTVPSRTPQQEAWPLHEIVAFIAADAGAENQVTVGTVSAFPQFSEPPLAYTAKADGLDIDFIRYTDPVPTLLDSDYVIVKTGAVVSGRIRSVEHRNADLVAQVLANPASAFYLSHERIDEEQQFPLPDGAFAHVYKRAKPVDPAETASIAAELLRINPDLTAAQRLLEETGAASIMTPQATETAEPLPAPPASDEEIEQLRQQAEALLAEGNANAAIEVLRDALERAPDRWVLRTRLAEIYQSAGQLEDAAREAEAAVDAAGQELWPLRTLAGIYRQQQRDTEAIDANTRILVVDPNNTNALSSLAMLYEKMGECDPAIAYQRRVVDLRPTNGTYTTLGDILMTCEQYGDAITAYREGINQDATVTRTHFVLARAYQATGSIPEAIAELQIVLQISVDPQLTARAQQLLDQLKETNQP